MKGKLKKQILSLLEKPKTATMLGKEIKKHRSGISRILLELEKRKLISCKNHYLYLSHEYLRFRNNQKLPVLLHVLESLRSYNN